MVTRGPGAGSGRPPLLSRCAPPAPRHRAKLLASCRGHTHTFTRVSPSMFIRDYYRERRGYNENYFGDPRGGGQRISTSTTGCLGGGGRGGGGGGAPRWPRVAARDHNTTAHRFNALFGCAGSEGTDALRLEWGVGVSLRSRASTSSTKSLMSSSVITPRSSSLCRHGPRGLGGRACGPLPGRRAGPRASSSRSTASWPTPLAPSSCGTADAVSCARCGRCAWTRCLQAGARATTSAGSTEMPTHRRVVWVPDRRCSPSDQAPTRRDPAGGPLSDRRGCGRG